MGRDVSREVAEEVVDLARLGVGGEASDEEGAELVPRREGLLRAVVVGAVSGGGRRRRRVGVVEVRGGHAACVRGERGVRQAVAAGWRGAGGGWRSGRAMV